MRQRGKALSTGKLYNEKSGKCLEVDKTDGKGSVDTHDCTNELDYFWTYYENGELINHQSNWCLAGLLSYVGMAPCNDENSTKWDRPVTLSNGEYKSYYNRQYKKCLDIIADGGVGSADLFPCDGLPDQRFKQLNNSWATPTASWNLIGCNQAGSISQTITNSVSYSEEVTTEVSATISATIEADVVFGKVSVSTSVSTSLANSWTST